MGGPPTAGRPSLANFVEPSRWQRLQDHFAGVLGIPLRTVSPSRELLVNPSWPAGFDAERAIALLGIGEELYQLLPVGEEPPLELSSTTTALGATYGIVPIHATPDEAVAFVIAGPVIVGPRESELQFAQRMAELGRDHATLWPLILSLKLYTFAGIRSALTLLEEVGSSLVQLTHQSQQLSAILPPTTRVDQAVVAYHTDRILHSLLEAATLATQAEGGSIMVYDAARKLLRLKAAQGLTDQVVSAASPAAGEGLAGLALEDRRMLLVDEQTSDPRLRSRMHRPEVVSSLVAPLIPDAPLAPIGVLNLRTSNRSRRFTAEHVELLRRLLDLAYVSLQGLRCALPHAQAAPSH